MKLGIDVLLADSSLKKKLQGQRVALVAHPASMTSDFHHSADALVAAGLRLSALFGPQHGIRGEQQDNMRETPDTIDPQLGLPVFSLYGEVRRPTERMMANFDVILFDIQDVGTRIYTFLTTLLYVLEEAAKHKKTVWVLDRPNPAGRPVEGCLLQPGWVSFVGAAVGLPMRHGLTMGEAAKWFRDHFKIDVDLQVVAMQGYEPARAPGFGWPLGELSWVNPSPNAATLSMARCFPGTVLIEGTHLSEGRGTTRPLEIVGAPDLNFDQVLSTMSRLESRWMHGCHLRPCHFLPTFQKHVGQICNGVQIHVDDSAYQHEVFKPFRLIALCLKAVRVVNPDYLIWRDFHYEYEKDRLAFDLINGGPGLRSWIDDRSAQPADLEAILKKDEAQWIQERRAYLLYS